MCNFHLHHRVENFQPKLRRGQVSLHWWKVYIVSGNGLMPPGRRSFAEPIFPDGRVHGANMWPIRGRKYPGGPHVGPMNLAIWVGQYLNMTSLHQNELTTLNKESIILQGYVSQKSAHRTYVKSAHRTFKRLDVCHVGCVRIFVA